MNTTHDPSEYIRGLQQILISDKKKIGFLFGAGTSMAFKKNASDKSHIPGIVKLTEQIVEDLTKKEKKYKQVFEELKEELGSNFNIEYILSNVIQKGELVGNGELNKLKKPDFIKLATDIKTAIKDKVSVHKHKTDIVSDLIHTDFAEWVCRADRSHPIEVFTTNYDFLFELGFEHKNTPYFDGFTGSFEPFFDAMSVESTLLAPAVTKLWKIHGSLGWRFDSDQKKVIRKNSDDNDDILVYPSVLKYNDAKKYPYVSLIDRLSNFLKQDDSVLFVCGYSFSDSHINEVIVSALKSSTTTHAFVLYYDEVCEKEKESTFLLQDKSKLELIAKETKKISVYGCRSAVIGGVLGEWKLRTEPDKDDTIKVNQYFDEDVPGQTQEIKKEMLAEEMLWTGSGKFLLPDFAAFVNFLTSMVIVNNVSKSANEPK
jgi:hypothetical protein